MRGATAAGEETPVSDQIQLSSSPEPLSGLVREPMVFLIKVVTYHFSMDVERCRDIKKNSDYMTGQVL